MSPTKAPGPDSVVHKVVAKVLASRLKPYLHDLISTNQSAFVPGRQIFDNVLVAFETLHSIAQKKIGKKRLMAIKLDMSKAYDRVKWSFLGAVMLKMNFPPRWIGLIMDCISFLTFSFLLNGQPVCKVTSSEKNGRGLGLDDVEEVLLFATCLLRR
ncbi:hypothetical protein Dsin_019206 [Dipteronia sinensis]|uniref:Reverse transcriptase domain-containing protein n=1 Tax=Dipteronia sinensis TaxID=43782 RepID=A0AAE0A736_9ROSI|nr:hypothetical protein Dsin_019206 [Dipteronia sinensis]